MLEIFRAIIDMPVPVNMIVLIVLFGCVTGMITGIAKEIRRYTCHRHDIDFKRELVDRGLGGDEIERIVSAPVAEKNEKNANVDGRYSAGAPVTS